MASSSSPRFIIAILTLGVFGILNTEMGVVGIIPLVAQHFQVSVPDAGWMVSLFALVIAFTAPVTPLLFSRMNRKTAMLLALSVFVVGNVVAALSDDFTVQLAVRAIQGLFHPVYVTIAFTAAAASVPRAEMSKAVARVFVGVSAGMVLGVPMTTFVGGHWGFSAAMWFFTAVNALVLLATIVFMPSMPVDRGVTYGEQLAVLKKPLLWASVVAAVLLNGAMFGFYSYLSDYLQSITLLSVSAVSVLLAVYGGANIIGNLLAGRLLAQLPVRTLLIMPLLLLLLDAMLLVFGALPAAMAVILLLLGVVVGIGQNSNQYMIASAAPEAPEFANGLFLTAANLGTTLGTFVCGLFIAGWGTQYSVLGAILFGVLGFAGVLLRIRLPGGSAAASA
ncbi:MAG: MFS transporter [Lautropia sp.]|nr:MFS transporter [Lautropia sp.]